MLKIAFTETLFKFLVNDAFHYGIDLDCSFFVVDQVNSFLDIDIDAFVDQSFCVLVGHANVKSCSSFQRKTKSFIMLL